MWRHAIVVLALFVAVSSQTLTHYNTTIRPMPHGGAFATPPASDTTPGVVSYLISTTDFIADSGDAANPELKVVARVFLGNQTYAGRQMEWTAASTSGDWTQVKTFQVIDPCDGLQHMSSTAFLLVDPSNLTLVSDVAVSSSPLRYLQTGVAMHGDASKCLALPSPMAGSPLQCPQFFKFDFSSIPDSLNGFSLNLTVTSTNGNPLPFSRAYLASGESCPTVVKDQNWYSITFVPNTPGVTPTRISFPGIANGTHERSWWVLLDVPSGGVDADTPFAITVTYSTNFVPAPVAPLAPTKAPTPKPAPPPQRPSKPIPIWAVVVISLGCISLASGALFWAWRLTRKQASSNSYEFY